MMSHADRVRRAQGPRLQVMQGAPGEAAMLLQAPRGMPSTIASGGRCALAHTVWDGGHVCALGGARQRQWGGGHRARVLAMGGLGVSGLKPACGLPYPSLGPPVCRGVAEGRPPRA